MDHEFPIHHLVEPVMYGDVFDFSLSIDDISRYCRKPMARAEVERNVHGSEAFGRVVDRRDGWFFLRGRDHLIEVRERRKRTSDQCWRRARTVVRFIRYTPFVRGILVTGSLAMNNARDQDDIDFLVITEPKRLWVVFAVLGTLQRVVSRRNLCPNYYLSIDHLELRRKSLFVAREAAQARPLCGAEACRRFWEANAWVRTRFPNAETLLEAPGGMMERRGFWGALVRGLEWVLRGRLGDGVEIVAKRLLRHRLTTHYGIHGQAVPEAVATNAEQEIELRFHGLRYPESIDDAFERRRELVEHQLADNDGKRADSIEEDAER